jgi:hypothetical protein
MEREEHRREMAQRDANITFLRGAISRSQSPSPGHVVTPPGVYEFASHAETSMDAKGK